MSSLSSLTSVEQQDFQDREVALDNATDALNHTSYIDTVFQKDCPNCGLVHSALEHCDYCGEALL